MVKCRRVPTGMLRPGAVLMSPISDPMNPRTRLLAQGTRITEHFIEQLQRRGIDSVILSVRDIAILYAFTPQGRRKNVPPSPEYYRSTEHNDYSKEIDQRVEHGTDLELNVSHRPLADDVPSMHGKAYADGLVEQWARDAANALDAVIEFMDDTMQRGASDVSPLRQACQDILDRIAEDRDALVALACTPFESDYPSRHGMHTAAVALAVGVEMQLDHEDLMDLGIGCLMHDLGMRDVGLRIFETKHPLTPGQLRRLADHPVRAVEIAGRYGDAISENARAVAYQIHERGDGSGYPRGFVADQIHDLAKIAAVADAFVGMLARRKHRHGIQGYYVIAKLLEEMKIGRFDAHVMRALLNVASLYPIGSFVELNFDCIGRVIRTGHEDFLRPTLEIWHKDYLHHEPLVVDLREETDTRILGSIPPPETIPPRASVILPSSVDGDPDGRDERDEATSSKAA